MYLDIDKIKGENAAIASVKISLPTKSVIVEALSFAPAGIRPQGHASLFINQYTPFFKNQHTFWKGYIKNRNVVNTFKKAFLVFKFNFLFPQSLDILKE